MEESVILQLPAALLLYGAAIFLRLFDRAYRDTRGGFTMLSALLAVGTTAYALLMGASLGEVCTVLGLFLLLNLGVKE